MRTLRSLIVVQSVYILITAVWPLVDIISFMEITGYKTDIWLVKTAGTLLFPVALTLATFLFQSTDKRPALLLGGLTAIAFIGIDFYYVLKEVIPTVYLLEGFLEVVLLNTWTYLMIFEWPLLKKAPSNLFDATESVSTPFQG